jgi:hypothetical protein
LLTEQAFNAEKARIMRKPIRRLLVVLIVLILGGVVVFASLLFANQERQKPSQSVAAETTNNNKVSITRPHGSTDVAKKAPQSTKTFKKQEASLNAAQIAALDRYQELDAACRGGPGNSEETWAACTERDQIDLTRLGLCHGKRGQDFAYQMSWHVCGPTSYR